MDSAVAFENVQFSYDDRPTLSNVTFSVTPNSFVGIIGPNGGGKTTLLKLAMGFLQPDRGEVKVFGESPSEVQNKIAYVPQNLRYDRYFPLSVLELVLMGRLSRLPWWGRYAKEDEAKAHEAIHLVGLNECTYHSIGTLSGGQFQRALIARALVSDPKLLILDEPTANVDSQAEQDIYKLLHSLSKRHTVMMVTHDLHVAVEIVDKIILVQNEVSTIQPKEVCNHFAMGLYHPPIGECK